MAVRKREETLTNDQNNQSEQTEKKQAPAQG
jgi:hypothetical protein